MDAFKIFKGLEVDLPTAITNGYAYITSDTGKVFVDISDSKRIQLSPGEIDINTAADGQVLTYNGTTGKWVAKDVSGGETDIFIATYGTTTYAEILEAYNAGKAIFCKKDRVTAPFLGETNPDLSETGFYFSTINGSVASLYKCLDSGTSTEWSISTTNLMPYGNYVTATTLNNRINRTTNVYTANTNYTTLMARGEKLLDATTFDAVTDWSTQLVNGAIAWRYS